MEEKLIFKKWGKGLLLFLALSLCCSLQSKAQLGLAAVIKDAVKKVVKALDLKIQRQQNKVIWLQNAQKTVENAMSKLKLKEISEWSDRQRSLYTEYFDELKKVKNAIATYQKIKSIINRQLQLVAEYKRAWGLLKQDKYFNPVELEHIYGVYTGLLEESLRNLDQLILVTNSFTTQMSDGKRMELIAQADKNIEVNLSTMRRFNQQNFRLSISRANDVKEAEQLKQLYQQ